MLLALFMVVLGAVFGIVAGILFLWAFLTIYKQKQAVPFKKLVLVLLALFGIGAWIVGILFTVFTIQILPEIRSLF